ncbi:MAG: hypothetical protein ACYCTV_07155 [Leptospirales bacterium]
MSGVSKIKDRVQSRSFFHFFSGLTLFVAIPILSSFFSTTPDPVFLSNNTPEVNEQGKLTPGIKLVGFDILQKAQKNIQHELGLPETSPLRDKGSQEQHPSGHSSFMGWLLLIIALVGFFAFIFIVYREWEKTKTVRKTDELNGDFSETPSAEAISGPVTILPPPIRIIPLQNIHRDDLYEPELSREEEILLVAKRLDSFLRSIRTSLGEMKDCFKISLYHFEEVSGLFHQVADSTGKGIQVFYTPRFLIKEQADTWKTGFSSTWDFEKNPDNGEVFSMAFPFIDSMGMLFALSVSKNGTLNIPIHWYGQFSDLIPMLQKKLLEYARLQYVPMVDTRNNEGDLDFRALESRSMEEVRKGKELGNQFTLVFLKLANASEKDIGRSIIFQEFFKRFKEKVAGLLRSSDSMTVLDKDLLMVLLPETSKIEAHYVFNRTLDLFNAIEQPENDLEIRLFSNLLEWGPESKEDLHQLIGRAVRFNIPTETNAGRSRIQNLLQ